MIPLPGAMQGAFSQLLQGIATRISVFVIQTLGLPAVAQGHLIQRERSVAGRGDRVQRIADDDAVLRHVRRHGFRRATGRCGRSS